MTPANRQYKDRLFRFLFGNEAYKENTLSLYNAINGTHYDNVNDLTLITIDDFLYLGMRNDVSMLVGRDISLYEHQSTWNPNMPLRGLMYFSRVFARYVEENGLDMYRRTPVSLPAPQYVILYNGEEDHGERTTLRLSDLYQDRRIGAVEVLATVIDINYEENKQILLSCRVLSEYAQLVAKVRDSQRRGSSLTEAIDAAVEDCISNGILAAVLKAHRAEVKEMLFTDYDPDVVRRHWEEDARAKGHAEGLAAGLAEGREEGLAAGREEGLKAGITKGSAEERLKIAKALKTEGMTTEVIVRVTGLTEEEIAAL